MFKNIGRKIKMLAKVICWAGIVLSIFAGIALAITLTFTNQDLLILAIVLGVLYAALGALISWIGTFVLYGLGQLVDNTDKLVAAQQQSLPFQPTEDKTEKSSI